MWNKIKHIRWLAVPLSLFLSGCALLYFPILLLTPFQPLLKLAAKVAARYGPILLMMIVEVPDATQSDGLMYATHIPKENGEYVVQTLEHQLNEIANSEEKVVAVVLIDAENVDEQWLAQTLSLYNVPGYCAKGILVDSRDAVSRGTISEEALALLQEKGIVMKPMPGRAALVCNQPQRVEEVSSAYAMLAGACAGVL